MRLSGKNPAPFHRHAGNPLISRADGWPHFVGSASQQRGNLMGGAAKTVRLCLFLWPFQVSPRFRVTPPTPNRKARRLAGHHQTLQIQWKESDFRKPLGFHESLPWGFSAESQENRWSKKGAWRVIPNGGHMDLLPAPSVEFVQVITAEGGRSCSGIRDAVAHGELQEGQSGVGAGLSAQVGGGFFRQHDGVRGVHGLGLGRRVK